MTSGKRVQILQSLLSYGQVVPQTAKRSLKIPAKPATPARRKAPTVPLEGGARGLGVFKDRQIFENTERLQRGKV